jgi:hypothetical protein
MDKTTWEIVQAASDSVKNLIEAGALLVGAWWAYTRFVANRENETALEISCTTRTTPYRGSDSLVAIEISLVNKGKVRVSAKRKINPAYMTDDEVLRFSGDLLVRAIPAQQTAPTTVDWFPTLGSRSPEPTDIEIDLFDEYMDDKQTDFWLEPGETTHIGKALILPAGHYHAMVTFIGDRNDQEFWRRLFYFSVPGTSSST